MLPLPAELVSRLAWRVDDRVLLEIAEDKLVVHKEAARAEIAAPATIEELFAGYAGGSFRTELTNPPTPLGAEQW
jgi:hypothetical protein